MERGWSDLLDFVLPRGCVVCRRWMPGPDDRFVCAGCRSRYRRPPWPRCARCHHPSGTGRPEGTRCLECADWPEALAAARYAYELRGPASRAVHALKYDGWGGLAREMGVAMAAATSDLERPDVVTYVPTTDRRRRERGYDQAERLAREVARVVGRPSVRLLERRGRAASQVRLDPLERRGNVREAFAPARTAREPVPQRVLLVDDVLTTGATAGAAALALTGSGVGVVALVTFGRALPRLEARTGLSTVA